MGNLSKYKGVDLETATIYDVAKLFIDKPPILISSEKVLTDEQNRILSLITYAENYNISDLAKQLKTLFSKELLSI